MFFKACSVVIMFPTYLFMQGVLHWVAQPSPGVNPLNVEVRLFDKLFLSEVGIAYGFSPCVFVSMHFLYFDF